MSGETAGLAARDAFLAATHEGSGWSRGELALALPAWGAAAAAGAADVTAELAQLREQLDATKTVLQETSRESSQRGEQARLARLELLQAQGEAAETAAELSRIKARHAAVLGKFTSNGSGYTARMSGTVLARCYADANLPVRDDLSHLAGQ